ncbi:MAG: PrsW family intramembrane metalloprotease [Anaerolineae bacterium]|nr:PrsW family intramembrane metalloprotease [Gloeobacterales cyanobacterium ES-bin-313]
MAIENSRKAFLKQIVADGSDKRHPLNDGETITLGRSATCQIVLDPQQHSGVSRAHAQLQPSQKFKSSGWQICDLNSANGTFVNGQAVTDAYILKSGDRISLGQNGPVFVFEAEALKVPTNPRKPANDDALSLTQLFPITSTGGELFKKGYLLPGILTVIAVVLLFTTAAAPLLFDSILAIYIAGMTYIFVYTLCGKQKPWWWLIGLGLLTFIMLDTPIFLLCAIVFRDIFPGDAFGMMEQIKNGVEVGIVQRLVTYFFGAGMCEEFFKAIPIFLCFYLGRKLKSPWREKLGVLEPLDGILIGAACGVGFTLNETLLQYVPQIMKTGSDGMLLGLQLLLPRILGNISGHMAYSGYFGYFIGLAALKNKPIQQAQVIGIGFVTAALIHGLWDTVSDYSPIFLVLIGVLAFAFLMAAILKARKLSPSRNQNFATQFVSPEE